MVESHHAGMVIDGTRPLSTRCSQSPTRAREQAAASDRTLRCPNCAQPRCSTAERRWLDVEAQPGSLPLRHARVPLRSWPLLCPHRSLSSTDLGSPSGWHSNDRRRSGAHRKAGSPSAASSTCPCRMTRMKRVPELRDLSDDHHTGLALARRCKQVGRAGSDSSPENIWTQVLEAFSSQLEPHFQIEEQHLLPALEAIGESSLADRIREDHRALRALRDSKAPSSTLLNHFGELLESHIRFEERQVFEATQDRLPADALARIAAACATKPRALAGSPDA